MLIQYNSSYITLKILQYKLEVNYYSETNKYINTCMKCFLKSIQMYSNQSLSNFLQYNRNNYQSNTILVICTCLLCMFGYCN